MVLGTVLVIALTQATPGVPQSDQAASAAPVAPAPPSDAAGLMEQRDRPRLHVGVGGGVGASFVGGGVGLMLDVGVVLVDRVSVFGRGTFDYALVSSMALASVMVAYGTDYVSLAAGVGYLSAGIWLTPGFSGVAVPLVLGLTPFGRRDGDTRRSGLSFSMEGGVAFATTASAERFTFFGGLRAGYVLR